MGARTGTAVAGVLLTLVAGGCDAAKHGEDDAADAPAASTSSTPSATETPARPRELSRGDGKRTGAAGNVTDVEIYAQLARKAERIANNTPLAPVPADIDRGSNRALGYQLMVEFGFPAAQWRYLDALWTRESGWNHLAENRSSGAYGIPQSLPGSKMAVVGGDWRTNPETQINWGLAYIGARYGSPQKAWAHSERVGWY